MRVEWLPSATAPLSLLKPVTGDGARERRAVGERRAKVILTAIFVAVAALLWWQVFQFTEARWWGFESEHAKKAPPRAPRIKVLGLESIDLDKAVEELSQRPSHMRKGGGEEFLR